MVRPMLYTKDCASRRQRDESGNSRGEWTRPVGLSMLFFGNSSARRERVVAQIEKGPGCNIKIQLSETGDGLAERHRQLSNYAGQEEL